MPFLLPLLGDLLVIAAEAVVATLVARATSDIYDHMTGRNDSNS